MANTNDANTPRPLTVDELLSRQEARQTAANGGGTTLATYQALVGNDTPVVRVKGLGEVGLRWHVTAVDMKKGLISLSSAGQDDIVATMAQVVINPVRRSSGPRG